MDLKWVVLEQLAIHQGENKIGFQSCIIFKNKLKIEYKFKWNNIKIMPENLGGHRIWW